MEDIQLGRQTPNRLKNMLEKDLVASYGVSRDTARKARDAVLSEMLPAEQLDLLDHPVRSGVLLHRHVILASKATKRAKGRRRRC